MICYFAVLLPTSDIQSPLRAVGIGFSAQAAENNARSRLSLTWDQREVNRLVSLTRTEEITYEQCKRIANGDTRWPLP
jgi:hypothetical protein